MKKTRQIGVRWAPEAKSAWEKLAKERFHLEGSTLARGVLEEYMACFLTDEELTDAGLRSLSGRRPGSLISVALRECVDSTEKKRRGDRVSEDSQELLIEGLRAIFERAPAAVVEDLSRRISDLAGKYCEEPEQRRPKDSSRTR